MHKLESVQEMETHKILWDLGEQINHLMPTRRSGLELIVMFWPFDPAKNAIQGDAPEGSETF